MKKTKLLRIIIPVLLLGAAAVWLTTSNLRKNEDDGTLKIGVAIYRGDDTFISNMMDSMKRIAADYEQDTGVRVNLNIMDAQENQSVQNDQVGRFLSLGYDVLCVNLVDRTDAARVITQAMNANTPVVFFNREPVQSDLNKWDRLYYVGADARESAQKQASIVINAYRSNPDSIDFNHDGVIQYIMMEGESRHQDTVIRTEVSVQSLREGGMQLEKLDGGIANFNRNQAAALAEQYFTQYGDQIELMICNNDDMALGVADTVERMELTFSNIVGIDATPQGREAVDQGKLLGTVSIGYEDQTQAMFDMALALAQGTDVGAKHEIREDRSVRVPQYIYVKQEEDTQDTDGASS